MAFKKDFVTGARCFVANGIVTLVGVRLPGINNFVRLSWRADLFVHCDSSMLAAAPGKVSLIRRSSPQRVPNSVNKLIVPWTCKDRRHPQER